MAKLIWLDIETTGLNPEQDAILEVAMVMTDYTPEFNELARGWWLLPSYDLDLMNDYVREMHTRSGLLEELRHVHTPRYQIADEIDETLDAWLKNEPDRSCRVAGASVHFDQSFMQLKHRALSHQLFDVSTLKIARDIQGLPRVRVPDTGTQHRAMSDITYSIAEARALLCTKP